MAKHFISLYKNGQLKSMGPYDTDAAAAVDAVELRKLGAKVRITKNPEASCGCGGRQANSRGSSTRRNPKMVGHEPKALGATTIEANANRVPGYTRVSFAQARKARQAGIPVVASLDTTDRGGPKTKAKRWYRWFIPTESATGAWATPSVRGRAWRSASGGGVARKNGGMHFSDKYERTLGAFSPEWAKEVAAMARSAGGKAKVVPSGGMAKVKVTFHKHSPIASLEAAGAFLRELRSTVIRRQVERHGKEPNETTLRVLMGMQ